MRLFDHSYNRKEKKTKSHNTELKIGIFLLLIAVVLASPFRLINGFGIVGWILALVGLYYFAVYMEWLT